MGEHAQHAIDHVAFRMRDSHTRCSADCCAMDALRGLYQDHGFASWAVRGPAQFDEARALWTCSGGISLEGPMF